MVGTRDIYIPGRPIHMLRDCGLVIVASSHDANSHVANKRTAVLVTDHTAVYADHVKASRVTWVESKSSSALKPSP
jgi:hypothetical protein